MAPPAASQSQVHQSQVEDPRFSELLKPIKDLTQNWEVPLADYLEQYMEDMRDITITFDGGQTSVNFAQAALILQGTASVYSKKIEFLYKLVLKMMDLLTNKEAQDAGDENAEDGNQPGGRKKKQVDMTTEFQLLEAIVGKNLEMKNDEDSLGQRKNELNFVYITPRQLIEKEGSETKAVKVNMFMGTKFDLLGSKEDFRVNGQFIVETGKLGDDVNIEDAVANMSISLCEGDSDDGGDILADDQVNDVSMVEEMEPQEMVCEEPTDALPLHNVSEMGQSDNHDTVNNPPDESIEHVDRRQLRSSDKIAEAPVNVTPETVSDPWEPLNPHEQLQTPKPLKKGRTIRYPPSIAAKHDRAKKGLPEEPVRKIIVPIEQYLINEMTGHSGSHAFTRVHSEFLDLAYVEHKRRVELEKRIRKARTNAKTPRNRQSIAAAPPTRDVYEDVEEDDPWDMPDQVDDGCDFPDDDTDDRLPDPHLGGHVGPVLMENDQQLNLDEDNDERTITDSYEDLVARRVAEFVQKSLAYQQSTELAKRVSHWHDTVGPRLEQVEKRGSFDVHLYGSRIINSFPEQNNSISFSRIVGGQPREEVARFFLSSLMLANTLNVDVGTDPGTDPFLGQDNVQLTLLSRTRHHEELEGFQAASQVEEDVSVQGSSQRKRGRKDATAVRDEVEEVDELMAEFSEEVRKMPDIQEENNRTFRSPEPPPPKKKRTKKK